MLSQDNIFGQVLGDGLLSEDMAMDDIVEDMEVGGTSGVTPGGPEGGLQTGDPDPNDSMEEFDDDDDVIQGVRTPE